MKQYDKRGPKKNDVFYEEPLAKQLRVQIHIHGKDVLRINIVLHASTILVPSPIGSSAKTMVWSLLQEFVC